MYQGKDCAYAFAMSLSTIEGQLCKIASLNKSSLPFI